MARITNKPNLYQTLQSLNQDQSNIPTQNTGIYNNYNHSYFFDKFNGYMSNIKM